MRAQVLLAASILTLAHGKTDAQSESDATQDGFAEVTSLGSVILRAEPTPFILKNSRVGHLADVTSHFTDSNAAPNAATKAQGRLSLLEAKATSGQALHNPFVTGYGSGSSGTFAPGGQTITTTPQGGQTITTTPQQMSTTITTSEHKVSCGGHTATRCRLCTVIDPETGFEIPDKGPAWCHGECKYIDGECHRSFGGNAHIAHQANPDSGVSTTQYLPDLLNPNITSKDRKLMDMAADRAIQEADYEAQQRLATETRKAKLKKDVPDKVIYIAIMTAACLLVCCACGAVFAVVKYIFLPPEAVAKHDDSVGEFDAAEIPLEPTPQA